LIEHFQALSAATNTFTRSTVLPAEASDFAVDRHSQSTSTNGSAGLVFRRVNSFIFEALANLSSFLIDM
jgi:hypothetical protein